MVMADEHATKRRWRPRFSLLTLLLGVVFVCACGGLWWRWEAWFEWVTLPEHPYDVDAVAVSPDGFRCATGCFDGSIRIWEIHTARCLSVLEGHKDPVTDLLWTVDGSRIISSGYDQTTRVWDANTYRLIGKPVMHEHIVWTIDQSRTGDVLATACADGKARIYVTGHSAPPVICQDGQWSMSFADLSPDGRRIVIGGGDTIPGPKVMDCTTGRQLVALQGNLCENYAAYSTDGTMIATAMGEGGLFIWDARTGASIMKLPSEKALIWTGFGCDDRRAFCTDTAGVVRVWDLQSRECLATFSDNAGSRACIGPNDAWILTSQPQRQTAIFYGRRRPEYWWGIAWLPEFWIALVSGTALLYLASCSFSRPFQTSQ